MYPIQGHIHTVSGLGSRNFIGYPPGYSIWLFSISVLNITAASSPFHNKLIFFQTIICICNYYTLIWLSMSFHLQGCIVLENSLLTCCYCNRSLPFCTHKVNFLCINSLTQPFSKNSTEEPHTKQVSSDFSPLEVALAIFQIHSLRQTVEENDLHKWPPLSH